MTEDEIKKLIAEENSKLKIVEFTEALKALYALDAEHDRINTNISALAIGGLLTTYHYSSKEIIDHFGLYSLIVLCLFFLSIGFFAYNVS